MGEEKYLSLFDFLGHPAGKTTGERVFKYARIKKIPSSLREVKTRTYRGTVRVYPKSFLEKYFKAYNKEK